VAAAIWGVVALLLVVAVWRNTRPGRRRRHIGAAASGTVYDWLNEDKRKAIEIIVEDRAAAHDPEDADGDLPQLQHPTAPRPKSQP
jgi:hypothetical protein